MHADPLQLPEEQPVAPGDDSDNEPTHPLPADPGPGAPERNPAVDTARGSQREVKSEEPEIGNERDVPSDGSDPEGEQMIRGVDKPSVPSAKPQGQ